MMNLSALEDHIRELIEKHLLALLPGQSVEHTALQEIASSMQANLMVKDGEKFSPNFFTLIVHPDDAIFWQDPPLLATLKEAIQSAGRELELKFSAPIILSIATDPSLANGGMRVIASHQTNTLGATSTVNPPTQPIESIVPKNAFLIIEGRKVFPLNGHVINIGRRLENQLVIEDPRVSRTHAQLRAIKGRYVIFDLNSTGGTFVNGQRTNQTLLYPGDVISLAGVTLIYGQDNPPPRPDLKETGPLETQNREERATAILKTITGSIKRDE